MSKQMIIDLPDKLYERFQQAPLAEREDIINEVLRVLDEELSHRHATESKQHWSDPDEAVEREMEAFVALHPHLKEKYFGQHVAIYGGKLIDFDPDPDALYARIDAKYPDEFVWLSKVEEEAMPTLVFRSPRLVMDESL